VGQVVEELARSTAIERINKIYGGCNKK